MTIEYTDPAATNAHSVEKPVQAAIRVFLTRGLTRNRSSSRLSKWPMMTRAIILTRQAPALRNGPRD